MTKYSKGFSGPAESNFDDDEEGETAMNGNNEMGMGNAEKEELMEIIASIFPLGGKPFSALNRQLLPKYFEQPQELFDEFGFRLPDSDGTSDPTAELPPLENSSHRMRWLAMVQSTHSQVEEDLIWAKVDVQRLRGAAKFDDMVHEEGIPHSLRPFLWPRLCGAVEKRAKSSLNYARILRKVERESAPAVDVQIEKDLLRTLPSHYSFCRLHSPGIGPLRRLLRSLAYIFPELGYCQGMGIVAGSLLLVCGEENSFWTMCCLIEDILPPSYYSPSLIGVRADERLLRHLVQVHMPELTEMMAEQNADTTMVFINWLITLLASAFSARFLFRIWDWLFTFGPSVIFRFILAMLKFNEEKLLERKNMGANGPISGTDLFSAITRIPGEIGRVEDLLEMAQSFEYSITDHLVNELRRKYQGIVMTETGLMDFQLKEGEQLSSKQKVTRRKLHRSKSIVRQIFQQKMDKKEREEEEDPRTKNIRQTELIMDLRNAILQICAYFAECKENQHKERQICTQANYSVGLNPSKEREEFSKCRREGQKRARALTDFEQKDEDDLAFHKNDLITIVSDDQDEHCWIGELDGRRGWFPAKFVHIIDERRKDYCTRGDEAICPRIAELARGPLAFAFRQILSHGIRQCDRQLGGILPSSVPSHPWPFIESIAKSIVPMDRRQKRAAASENSKMNLCNTFRLDQDGNVLGPEELLHLAVRTIHRSHSPVNAPMDGKFRSLIVFGLNQQCLHLWFDIFCHAADQEYHRKRHFHSWSFIRSPASQQISCELKLLAQFGFNLDVDSEIVYAEELKTATTKIQGGKAEKRGEINVGGGGGGMDEWERRGPLKDGVQDMLIKHHLFSWDL